MLLLFLTILWMSGWWWLWWGWCRQPQHLPALRSPLSVIIAARNEAPNLPRLLASLEALHYPSWEIILVLDRCEDQSLEIARAWLDRLPMMKIFEINQVHPGWSPKKWAIHSGIQLATSARLVFTDADCRVESGWLDAMNEAFELGAGLVLGIGLHEPGSGWLQRVIRYETAFTAFQYVGAAGWGKPYMGVGRNLGYLKTHFESVGGFADHASTLSGDDDLLVNSLAGKVTVHTMTRPGSRTWSLPKTNWRGWWRQKTRHVSGSVKYSRISQLLLASFHILQGCWWGVALGGFISNVLTIEQVLALYVLRIFPVAWAWRRVDNVLSAAWWEYPVLDLVYFLYNLMVIPWGLIRKPAWK